MNSDNSLLTVFGKTEGKPVIIELETTTSLVKKFIELDISSSNEDQVILGAIYSDKHDQSDHLYASYINRLKPTFLRLNNMEDAPASVGWSYDIEEYSRLRVSTILDFIIPDPNPEALWIGGLIDGKGSIFKFKKQTGSVYGLMEFNKIDTMDAFAANAE